MGIRCPKCKGILSPHAKRCPEPDCGWSVVPEDSNVYQDAPVATPQGLWPPMRDPATTEQLAQRLESLEGVVVVLKDGTANALQRLEAAELAINDLRTYIAPLGDHIRKLWESRDQYAERLRQLESSDPCLPVCECQPAEEFTVDQMASAISQWLDFGESANNAGYFKRSGWAARALRAARDHILAGKRSG